jgi:hypothetical protein
MDKDNANPIVLNSSELPTRQTRTKVSATGPGAKYHDLIFSSPAPLYGSSDDESDLDGSDDFDFAEEPIDAQEVYGKGCLLKLCLVPCLVIFSLLGHFVVGAALATFVTVRPPLLEGLPGGTRAV